jgi:hypothetical protein
MAFMSWCPWLVIHFFDLTVDRLLLITCRSQVTMGCAAEYLLFSIEDGCISSAGCPARTQILRLSYRGERGWALRMAGRDFEPNHSWRDHIA